MHQNCFQPRAPLGSLQHSPDLVVGWGRGQPLPILSHPQCIVAYIFVIYGGNHKETFHMMCSAMLMKISLTNLGGPYILKFSNQKMYISVSLFCNYIANILTTQQVFINRKTVLQTQTSYS